MFFALFNFIVDTNGTGLLEIILFTIFQQFCCSLSKKSYLY